MEAVAAERFSRFKYFCWRWLYHQKNINLGMAASLPNGNLIVPVIKNADQLNLVGMAKP
jgi:pyruvate/2-oxoglutarate dehydrogenase complex dihydrolipoamide acyltransferase (E2) component